MKVHMNFDELTTSVVEWARVKGILDKGTREGQAYKTLEEAQELMDAVDDDDRAEIIDAIGDVLVTVIIQAEMNGLNVTDCLQSAYDVIAKRSGTMLDGVFVKDGA